MKEETVKLWLKAIALYRSRFQRPKWDNLTDRERAAWFEEAERQAKAWRKP